jgi:hypothetical protein
MLALGGGRGALPVPTCTGSPVRIWRTSVKKLADLVKLESILAETVAQCSDGATPDCPVLDILRPGKAT